MPYQAEYIWIDGHQPTPTLRSKTKIIKNGVKVAPIWGFDGSSTEQATGDASDCVLNPVFTCPDPLRGGNNILVLCEVLVATTGKPHPTNTRATCAAAASKYASHGMIYGIEQEYTMMRMNGRPLGFPETTGEPGPQGPYYCAVGAGRVIGRPIIEEHTQACLDAGLMIEGTNAEVTVSYTHLRAHETPEHLVCSQATKRRLERSRCTHQLLDEGNAWKLCSNRSCM